MSDVKTIWNVSLDAVVQQLMEIMMAKDVEINAMMNSDYRCTQNQRHQLITKTSVKHEAFK